MMRSHRWSEWLTNGLAYIVLIGFALVMIFPFVYMLTTSFKLPSDTFRYPPRLLPRDSVTVAMPPTDEELPLFWVEGAGRRDSSHLWKATSEWVSLSIRRIPKSRCAAS